MDIKEPKMFEHGFKGFKFKTCVTSLSSMTIFYLIPHHILFSLMASSRSLGSQLHSCSSILSILNYHTR